MTPRPPTEGHPVTDPRRLADAIRLLIIRRRIAQMRAPRAQTREESG